MLGISVENIFNFPTGSGATENQTALSGHNYMQKGEFIPPYSARIYIEKEPD